jgi:hypothetical protein
MSAPPAPSCPANAWCGSAALAANQAWGQLLANPPGKVIARLGQKHGFPLPVWAVLPKPTTAAEQSSAAPPPADLPSNFIGWDSSCRHHQDSSHLILKGYSFQKNLKDVARPLAASQAWGTTASGQLISWMIPAGETPILREGQNLIFTLDFEGKYFHLKIDPAGKLTYGEWQLNGRRPREVTCPPALQQKGQAALAGQDSPASFGSIFQESFCKEIWDLASNSYQTMLFFWACD